MFANRLVLVALLLCGIAATCSAQNGEVTLEQIHAAWGKRQERVKRARFKWIEVRTFPRGCYGQKGPNLYPPEDTSQEFESEVLISGSMIRYEWKGIEWRNEKKQFVEKTYRSASDGTTIRTLYSNHIDKRSKQLYPVGFIKTQLQHEDTGNPHVEIPIFSVRALTPGVGCAGVLNRVISPTGLPALSLKTLDGLPHAVIEQDFGEHTREVWVDPSKDFVISRYVVHLHGNRFYQISATYQRDDQIGWLPETWRIDRWIPTSAALEAPRSGVRGLARLADFEINPKLSADIFRPPFPVGTIVIDNRKERQEHLVREDGWRSLTSIATGGRVFLEEN
ncbi:MAG: hypothetical protein WD894_00730, partial [Pirellulales bacterium]